jgi:hypothetical protein
LEDLRQVRDAERRHTQAHLSAASAGDNVAVAHQRAQRAAHWRTADAERRGDIGFHDARPGRQSPAADLLAELFVDVSGARSVQQTAAVSHQG